MTTDRIEQLKARLRWEEREKEEAFQKRLEEIKAEQAPLKAEREGRERTEHQERERLHEERRRSREEEMKSSARLAWLDAGGKAQEFEKEWPQMRTQMLRERALQGDSAVRREQRTRNVRAFLHPRGGSAATPLKTDTGLKRVSQTTTPEKGSGHPPHA